MLHSGDRRREARRALRSAAVRCASGGRRLAGSPRRGAAEWHYVDIDYGGYLLGLLVETGDEVLARREAEDICSALGNSARVLDVRRAVIQ